MEKMSTEEQETTMTDNNNEQLPNKVSYADLQSTVLKQGEEIEQLKSQVAVLMQAVASLTKLSNNSQQVSAFNNMQNVPTGNSSYADSPSKSTTSNSSNMNIKAPAFTPLFHNSKLSSSAQQYLPTSTNSVVVFPARCEFGTNCRKEHCASLHQTDTEGWCHLCRLHCVSLLPSELKGMLYYYKQCFKCGYNNAPMRDNLDEVEPVGVVADRVHSSQSAALSLVASNYKTTQASSGANLVYPVAVEEGSGDQLNTTNISKGMFAYPNLGASKDTFPPYPSF